MHLETLAANTPNLPFWNVSSQLNVPALLTDWENEKKPLTESARKRMVEMQRLQQELAQVLDPTSLGRWLATPAPEFQGLKPLEVIERGEIDRIWQMIFRRKAGQIV